MGSASGIRGPLRSLASAIALAVYATTGWAQSDEQRASARALATQGADAYYEQRWQDAADLFERAETLVHAPTHLLFGARSQVKLGHFVKARELYIKITQLELGRDATRAFREAQRAAERELGDVETHIGQLTISVTGGDPKLAKVTMDGTPVPNVVLGVWRPVDPGDHEIRVEAPGFRAETTRVTVREGGKANALLSLVADEGRARAPTEPPAALGAPADTPGTTVVSDPAKDAPGADTGKASASSPMRIGSYFAFGVGAVGLGVGTFFLLKSSGTRSDADAKFAECGGASHCSNDNPLSRDVTSLDDSARAAQTVGIVGLAAGGAAVATGVVLLALGRANKPNSAVTVMPSIGLGSIGAVGEF